MGLGREKKKKSEDEINLYKWGSTDPYILTRVVYKGAAFLLPPPPKKKISTKVNGWCKYSNFYYGSNKEAYTERGKEGLLTPPKISRGTRESAPCLKWILLPHPEKNIGI